jgi:hypothetical protein
MIIEDDIKAKLEYYRSGNISDKRGDERGWIKIHAVARNQTLRGGTISSLSCKMIALVSSNEIIRMLEHKFFMSK